MSGTGGQRTSECEEENNCFFGDLSLGAGLGIGPKFEAILCVESFWSDTACVGLDITPINISANLLGQLSWNGSECSDGFSATARILDITVKAEFKVTDGIGISWSHTFNGFSLF